MTGYWLFLFIALACALAMHDKPQKDNEARSDAQPGHSRNASGTSTL